MKFLFKAKNESGKMREGIIEAMNWDAAAEILEKNGYTPITIKEEKRTQVFMKAFEKVLEGVSHKDLKIFFRQLATLVESHVAIITAISTIEEQSDNKYFRIILKEMASDIKEGLSLSSALEKHEDIFSSLTVNMIRAGEISGSLQKSVEFVADSIDKTYELNSKIKSALYYPIFVLSAAGIIGFLVVTFILPKITIMIKELKMPVPWYTQALVSLGDFMQVYWWAVLLGILLFIVGFTYYIRSKNGQREWQMIVLKIPVVGTLARNIFITRFADNLSALLNSGIPVVRALIIVSEIVGNDTFRKIIIKASEDVKVGGTMSESLSRTDEIPPIVSQMLRIGEETGTLPGVLLSVGKFYSQEVDSTTKNLTVLMEPILIVFLGIGVAIMVVGVLMPIYDIAGQM